MWVVFLSCLCGRRWSCRSTRTRVHSSTWSRPEKVSSRAWRAESEATDRSSASIVVLSSHPALFGVSMMFGRHKTVCRTRSSGVIPWRRNKASGPSDCSETREKRLSSYSEALRHRRVSWPLSLFIPFCTFKCFTCSLLLDEHCWVLITNWTSRASDPLKSSVPNPSESSN